MEETLKLILSELKDLKQGQKRIEDKLDGLQEEFETSIQDLATHIDSKFEQSNKAEDVEIVKDGKIIHIKL